MVWQEDEFLMVSGLQHFAFCRRQWALIHVEHQWAENYRTTDGELMHKNAHDRDYQESRGDTLIIRGLNVRSQQLGIYGICDVVEFHRDPDGISLSGRDGQWMPFPIEYKRGKPENHTHADELQLCAQAMCLEEMLCCQMSRGAIFYGESRHRQIIDFISSLRKEVEDSLSEMHQLYQRGYTPKVKSSKSCRACSLRELCLPELLKATSASAYLHQHMEDEV